MSILLNRDQIIKIISDIVDLSQEDRDEFASILKRTKLENVISTLKCMFLSLRSREAREINCSL